MKCSKCNGEVKETAKFCGNVVESTEVKFMGGV